MRTLRLAILGFGTLVLGAFSVFGVSATAGRHADPLAPSVQPRPGDPPAAPRRYGDQPISGYCTPADVWFSPDGSRITGAFYKGNIGWAATWDRRTGAKLGQLEEQGRRTFAGAYLPGGKRMLTASLDDTMLLWNLQTREAVPLSSWPTPMRPGVQSWLWNVKLSPDGRTVAGPASPPGADPYANGIELREIASGRSRGTLAGPDTRWATAFAFSPDGRHLLGGIADGCCLWDLATGKIVRRFENTAGARSGAFAPDGRSVALAGEFRYPEAGPREWQRVQLIDLETGRTRHGKYTDFNNEGEKAVTYSPDGRVFATISMRDPRIHLWDPSTAAELAVLEFPSAGTFSGGIAFAHDGVSLATTTSEGFVLVWDLTQMPACKKLLDGASKKEATGHAAEEKPALSGDTMNALWKDLASADGVTAYRATWELARHRHEALELLRERLRPAGAPKEGDVACLLAGLDDTAYATRQRSGATLAKLAPQVLADLRAAKESTPSAEVRRRLGDILAALDSGFVTDAETLRVLHAVEALEHIGNPEAIALLREMAKGVPEAPESKEAAFALQRLTGN
jgi:hypothetical protein